MRALIDLTALSFNFSGIERYALNIAKNILELDTQNQYDLVFSNEIFPELVELTRRDNVRVHILKCGKKKLSKLILFQIKLVYLINKINPDYAIFPAFAAPIFLKRKNMIDTFHDLGYFDCPTMWKWYVTLYGKCKLKASSRHSDFFVAVSDYTKMRMIEFFGISQEKIFVAKNAVDERFNTIGLNEKEVELLKVKYNLPQSEFYMCLATLEPRKNLRLLIDAYADLILEGRTDKKLVLAGRRGWKINDLLNNLDENVKNNIVLTGFIDDKDLPKLYKSASVFIFPSLYEGFGIPALEALACGTQTIVSNIPIFKEAFGDAVTYFLNNDKDDLKNKMITYKDVDSSVIKKQVEKYDWGKSAKVYIINSR